MGLQSSQRFFTESQPNLKSPLCEMAGFNFFDHYVRYLVSTVPMESVPHCYIDLLQRQPQPVCRKQWLVR